MKKMLKKKSKGFTLVELLIVIIIIGILAGMMMLSTGSATAKAEAAKIVANMRNMKSAAVMVYADSNKWPTAIASLDEYIDQKLEGTNYTLESDGAYIYIKFDVSKVDDKVQESLGKLASTGVALYTSAKSGDITSSDIYINGDTGIYMPVK